MGIIYFFVAFLATTLGALAGLGGGVIIKPALDLIGDYDIVTISLLSSFTVFSMAIVSTYKQAKKGFQFDRRLIYLAIGAILGGVIGKLLFSLTLNAIGSQVTSGGQSILLGILLLVVLFKSHLPNWEIKSSFIILIIGLVLGTIASYLGIGGGPINVAVIMMFLNMDIKEAAIGSVFIILLSQLSKIIVFIFTGGLSGVDLTMLYFMIPAAVAGGYVGFWLSHYLTQKHIHRIFGTLVGVLSILNFYNAYVFLA